MHKFLGKKAAVAAAIAAVVLAVTAAAAFAAPVLQPGTTSAPGMSGTCTDCHTYAKPAATVAPKAPSMSKPYLPNGKIRVRRTFKTYGFVSPSLPTSSTQTATLTVTVQRLKGKKWVAFPAASATGTVSATGKFKGKTNWTAKLKIGRVGTYRFRAKLTYLDASAVEHVKYSKWAKIKVKK